MATLSKKTTQARLEREIRIRLSRTTKQQKGHNDYSLEIETEKGQREYRNITIVRVYEIVHEAAVKAGIELRDEWMQDHL